MRLESVLKDGMRVGLVAGALACASVPLLAQDQAGDQAANAPAEEAAPAPPSQEPAPAPPSYGPEALAAAKVVQGSLDAWRARNFEGWIAKYHPDVIVYAPRMRIEGRKELRAIYRAAFDLRVPSPDILSSGWTGERVFVSQQEYFGKGVPGAVTYAEYEVTGGVITTVYAREL
ncbi:MAG: nuclear transport factor 2 family protein [Pseudomonadota bacterium]